MRTDSPGRGLLRALNHPDVLSRTPLASRFFSGTSLDEARSQVIQAIRWCLHGEARLLYIFDACEMRGEPHKKVAADLHLTRRHFYRLRKALVQRIEQALPHAELRVQPAVTLRDIDALVRLIDLNCAPAALEQIDTYRAEGANVLPLTIDALDTLAGAQNTWDPQRVSSSVEGQSTIDASIARAIHLRAIVGRTSSKNAAAELAALLCTSRLTSTPYLLSSCFTELGAYYHRSGDVLAMIAAFQKALDALLEYRLPAAMVCEAQTLLASAKLASIDGCESAIVDLLTAIHIIERHSIFSARPYVYMMLAFANKTILNGEAAREYAARAVAESRCMRGPRAAAILSGAARIEAALGHGATAMQWANAADGMAPELAMRDLRRADVLSHFPNAGRVHVSDTAAGGCSGHAHFDGSRLLVEARSERADRLVRRDMLKEAIAGLRRGAPLHEVHDALELLKCERAISPAEERERREMLRVFSRVRAAYSTELVDLKAAQ